MYIYGLSLTFRDRWYKFLKAIVCGFRKNSFSKLLMERLTFSSLQLTPCRGNLLLQLHSALQSPRDDVLLDSP